MRFFSAGLSNFEFAYRKLLQRKCSFPKIGSIHLFQLWRNFPSFWQAFEIFKLWLPVARWGKKTSLRNIFSERMLSDFEGNKIQRLAYKQLGLGFWSYILLVQWNLSRTIFLKKTYRFAFFSDSDLSFFGRLVDFLGRVVEVSF